MNNRIGFFTDDTHKAEAARAGHPKWKTGPFEAVPDFLREAEEERRELPYEIDGLVIKVNTLTAREQLGYTGHHPRWALAYKFDAPRGVTEIIDIDVQVGRTGRITPVARVKPVVISGSTVSNVTLHNQDYIDLLELALGDKVNVSKRGDVIPAVESVVEKNTDGNRIWKIPDTCPSCGNGLIKKGAHHFCINRSCPTQIRQRIHFFIGSGQMDIENLGPETVEILIERGMVQDVDDLYTCDYDSLLNVKGFGEKKIDLIKQGIEKSKEKPFPVVLRSLGIPELGQKAAELLMEAGFTSIRKLLDAAEREDAETLTAIPGIGPKTARTIIEELSRDETKSRIASLEAAGLRFAYAGDERTGPAEKQIFSGQSWCVTGSFENFQPRSLAMEEIKKRGGKTVSQVSGATTHLLAGSGGGSKRKKARELGITVVSEEEFLTLLQS